MKKSILKLVLQLGIVLIGLNSCSNSKQKDEPTIIGHRGLPTVFAENTMESFDGLLNAKIYQVETDLLLAKGDTIMIFHDNEVSRLTNLSGEIINFTPTQLKEGLKAKSNETCLTLVEFLDKYQSNFERIFFDLKIGQGSQIYTLIDQLVYLINQRGLANKIILTSPSESILEYIQSKDAKIKLASDFGELGVKSAISHHFEFCLLDINTMSKSLYSFAKTGDVSLIAYTTKNIVEVEKAIVLGCDGIMTDVALEMKVLYDQ